MVNQTRDVISRLKENNQDFEFYPTTPEILRTISSNMSSDSGSVLDCGAGNGSALKALTSGKRYAIEKSQILIKEMDSDIFVVGCDFFENSLIDKKVDTVFCNPPYSQYKEWCVKLIMEANAKEIFLVIPERWKDQPAIAAAVEHRKAEIITIGQADFLEADRSARAKVEILRVNLQSSGGYYRDSTSDIDPFKLWVEQEFPLNERKLEETVETEETLRARVNEMVPGRNLVSVLVELYQQEMMTLQSNFRAISQLDQSIFKELKVDFSSMTSFLRGRIVGLKERYWNELFNNLEPITSRLTHASRKSLLETLTNNVSVDFTEENIYAVTTWAIKNVNKFLDSQLVDVFTGLSKKANCVKYKSNLKTWGGDDWRFREDMREGKIKNYGLDYRCVISHHNTFSRESWNTYEYPNGLHKIVHTSLNDIVTIANNLGFCCPSWEDSKQKEWTPGKEHKFYMNKDHSEILMAVRAYKNGNIHIKFNQKFLRKLNVEFGRLKGWLRDYKQASKELGIPEFESREFFRGNYTIDFTSTTLLITE